MQLEPQAISIDVILEKYCKGTETDEKEIFQRVAKGISSAEKNSKLQKKWEALFYKMMVDGGIGGGRIMAAAGTDIQATLNNCYVNPIGDSIIDVDDDGLPGIYVALAEAAETLRRGGGVGYDFSNIRPMNAYVKGTSSFASGPCSYMDVFDKSCSTVESAGCFSPDTLVDTTVGKIRIEDIVKLDQVYYALTHLGPRQITAVFDNGLKEAFLVKTELGNEVTTTIDHKYATYDDELDEIVTLPLSKILADKLPIISATVLDQKLELQQDRIVSTESVGKINVYDLEVDEVHLLAGNGVYTSNSRRGAQLAALRVSHPDIESFITGKRQQGRWNNFNVSVFVTDEFMKAVKEDKDFQLTHKAKPTDKIIQEKNAYQRDDGIWVYETIKAVDLWEKIMRSNYDFAEPGILFDDNINNDNNLRYCENIKSTNPCVTGDTLILTNKGNVRIDSVVNQEIGIWNGFEWSSVIPTVTAENQEIYDLIFSDGSKLACTPYHKFILDNGERIEAYSLTPGHKLSSWLTEDGFQVLPISLISKTLRMQLEDKVYCFNEKINHSGIFNGILTANCGEQPLPPYGCCDLGSIILPKLVIDPFTRSARFDFDLLETLVGHLVRFLDNVLDVTFWPLAKQKEEAMNKRRIGLGFTGLGNTLAMLNLRYDRDEGREMAEVITSKLTHAAYRASINLAAEKGSFPLLDIEKYLEKGTFASRLPEDIKNDIRKYGIRNSHLTTVAPGGTVSLAFADNASNGIEPPFSLAYTRKKRKQHGGSDFYTVVDHGVRVFLSTLQDKKLAILIENALCLGKTEINHLDKDIKVRDHLPKSIVTAMEMKAEDHLAMLRVLRPYIDSAMSKTVNVPADYPFEDFKNIYLKAHEYGLKGVATYRPNDILGSVLSEIKKEEPKVEPEKPFKLSDNTEFDIFMNKVVHQLPNDEYLAHRKKISYIGPEGNDNLYILLSIDQRTFTRDGKTITVERPVEVFIETNPDNVPSEWVDSLSRNLSLLARSGINMFIKALDNCKKAKSDKGRLRYGWIHKPDGTKVPRYHASQIDCIGFAIKEVLQKRNIINDAGKLNTLDQLFKLQTEAVAEDRAELLAETFTPEEKAQPTMISGKVCEECGAAAVIKKDGCSFCTNCGAEGACG